MSVPTLPSARTDRGEAAAAAGAEVAWIVAATLVSLTLAGSILLAGDGGREATRLALRATARLSFVYFIVAFVASPLARLRPGPFSRWLVRRRRAFGVAFGASMTVHVGCILRLYTLYAPERPPMVTDADFLIGIPGLVMVGLMTVTSLVAIRRRIGPTTWHRLHRVGIYVVWSIFFLCLSDSVGRKETAHPVLGYYLFIGVLVSAMALRFMAWRVPARVRGTVAMEDAR